MRSQTLSKANHVSGNEVEEQKPVGRETKWSDGRWGKEGGTDCVRPFSSRRIIIATWSELVVTRCDLLLSCRCLFVCLLCVTVHKSLSETNRLIIAATPHVSHRYNICILGSGLKCTDRCFFWSSFLVPSQWVCHIWYTHRFTCDREASQKYHLEKNNLWFVLTWGDVSARAPCTQNWGAGHGREDSAGLGSVHEVIYSQTTAELRTEIGQSLSLSRGCTAGASLDSALSILAHCADMHDNNGCLIVLAQFHLMVAMLCQVCAK